MDANRFYSIPWDARNAPAMKKLRRKHGDLLAYGLHQALIGILYDEGNRLHWDDPDDRGFLCDELGLPEHELDAFLNSCAKFELIDCDAFFGKNVIRMEGVQKELDYRAKKSRAGTRGGISSGKTRQAAREAGA